MRKISTQLLTRGVATVTVATAILMFGAANAQKKEPMPQAQPPASTGAPAAAPAGGSSNEALFKRIDTDGDGSISKAELEKFDPEAAKSFDKYDTDKDSKLSMSEFDAMVKGLKN
jgi:EF hand